MKSLQEIFTTVVQHLRQQQCKSQEDASLVCQYRITNEEGETLKCAVGCLIGDGYYNHRMEGQSLPKTLADLQTSLEGSRAINYECKLTLLIKALKQNEVDVYEPLVLPLLSSLQHIHDECNVDAWEPAFKQLAVAFKLQLPTNDTVKA